jgi:predicted nuclease with TOPRIM domain
MELNEKLMEEILLGIKDLQKSNLEILSRVVNIEDRVTNIEDRVTNIEGRVTNIEENQVDMTDRISSLEQKTNEGFARLESKLNNVIISNQLMNYTYESIRDDHKLHARFMLSMSKRITKLEKKDKNLEA